MKTSWKECWKVKLYRYGVIVKVVIRLQDFVGFFVAISKSGREAKLMPLPQKGINVAKIIVFRWFPFIFFCLTESRYSGIKYKATQSVVVIGYTSGISALGRAAVMKFYGQEGSR